ncbi:beta-1,3-glucosyltransferase [Aplysia californica]|uniref:Beta-1,3-glucosyltransferase n=1 Tax=Aplysia californica TaxID=6500 RepID=A0ABM1ACL0_APLCA|nr:beta-1,3-glucosyltransferase [Aplysia californica]
MERQMKTSTLALLLGCLCGFCLCSEQVPSFRLEASQLVFVVLSQPNDYHVRQAEQFKKHFEEQLTDVHQRHRPSLYLTHSDFLDSPGAWTLFPLIEELTDKYKGRPYSWVCVCEEDTRVNLARLTALLQRYDSSKEYFLGRELRDLQATIIHHFSFANNPGHFTYPDTRAGVLLSVGLIHSLRKRLTSEKLFSDFSIDPKHELALFVWDNGKGSNLTHVQGFCSADESADPNCVTTQRDKFPDCGAPVAEDELFVAVKTCHKFHESRVSVVKATWGKEAKVIEYYSEVEDASIPTVDLGVPNTERGHCGKTMAIIQRIMKSPRLSRPRWVLIADDDTIIHLPRLRALLACYNFRQPVALGERYGYGQGRGGGYDYITGGGGMVFSQPAIRLLSERCGCYSDDSPDDMTLGRCLKSIGIPSTHSRYFHQARPDDYSPNYLANQLPVSFHKHWNNDPYKVYADLVAEVTEVAGVTEVAEEEVEVEAQREESGKRMTETWQSDGGGEGSDGGGEGSDGGGEGSEGGGEESEGRDEL